MPITTEVVSSILVHGEVHSIQHNVIKFVRDLRKVYGFLWILGFPPPKKMAAMVYNWHIVECGVKYNNKPANHIVDLLKFFDLI